jgi:hypothetical protein
MEIFLPVKRCQPCWCSLEGAGPGKCLYIGTNQSWFAMISEWVNNSGNLKELRSCCLASGYGRMGSKGWITLRNVPWWCGHMYQIRWTSWRLAGSAGPHDHSQHSSVRDSTLYMQSMQYSPRELKSGHMALHELMKLFFCLMILCELGLNLSPST